MPLNPEAVGDNGPRSRPVAVNDQDWAVLQVCKPESTEGHRWTA